MKPILQFDPARLRKAALLAVFIFGLFVTVQTVHAHPLGQLDDAHCSICQAAHSSVIAVALSGLAVWIVCAAVVHPAEQQSPRQFHSTPRFIRPPPAVL
jgi:hypothetical protein